MHMSGISTDSIAERTALVNPVFLLISSVVLPRGFPTMYILRFYLILLAPASFDVCTGDGTCNGRDERADVR